MRSCCNRWCQTFQWCHKQQWPYTKTQIAPEHGEELLCTQGGRALEQLPREVPELLSGDIPSPPGCVPVSQLWGTLPPAGIRLLLSFSGQPWVPRSGGVCGTVWMLLGLAAGPDSLWEPSACRARVRSKQGDCPDSPQPEPSVTLSINTPVSPCRTADPGDSKCHTDSQGLLVIM